MGKKYFDSGWDYKNENTKYLTHGFHNYPAVMIPQIAGRLIDSYYKNPRFLFDPYCGSGTSLVEASHRGINSIGTDLNPLARLLSRVKTSLVDMDELKTKLSEFYNFALLRDFGVMKNSNTEFDKFQNIDYWFDATIQKELSIIKNFILKIGNKDIADFFKVSFSGTARESSWTRNGEFKLYRMSEKQRSKFEPDVFAIMSSKLNKAFSGLEEYASVRNGDTSVGVYDFDTVVGIPSEVINDRQIDLVVTSPPYGDSRTTVAYGQYSRLSNEWLEFKNARQVDRMLMGGTKNGAKIQFRFEILDEILERIRRKDSSRVLEVISFYNDYCKSICNVSKYVRKGGFACYVVGNRKVKGEVLPTDEITRHLFERNGFEHIETIIRNIPNKRMPSKNSPSNVPGQVDSTMTNEFIVIMKKLQKPIVVAASS